VARLKRDGVAKMKYYYPDAGFTAHPIGSEQFAELVLAARKALGCAGALAYETWLGSCPDPGNKAALRETLETLRKRGVELTEAR